MPAHRSHALFRRKMTNEYNWKFQDKARSLETIAMIGIAPTHIFLTAVRNRETWTGYPQKDGGTEVRRGEAGEEN